MIDEKKLIEYTNNQISKSITANDIARFQKEAVLVPPVNIGDKLYKCGHGNRKLPEEWTVYYLGYNGEDWEVSIVRYENQDFVQSLRITEDQIDDKMFFRVYDVCKEAIEKRKENK